MRSSVQSTRPGAIEILQVTMPPKFNASEDDKRNDVVVLPGLKEPENFRKLVMAMKRAEASKLDIGKSDLSGSGPTSNLFV